MKASIHQSEIAGRVRAPSSKSYTIRGLMCAALAKGKSEIVYPLSSDDTEAAINVLRQVGTRIQQKQDVWQVISDDFHKPTANLHCGESAATIRFMTAICSLVPGRCQLVAGPSLSKRPIETLIKAIRQLGVNCSHQGEGTPVVVEGGKLKGGTTALPGDISSQFVSALLLIAPFANESVRIRLTTPLESKPFILMTLECLGKFGVKVESSRDLREFDIVPQRYTPARYEVEGDWSSASYLLALGAVGGEIEVENLKVESRQGDKVILDLLKDMGALVEIKERSIIVKKSRLNAIQADLSDCIDLLPTVAVLASNRVSALKDGLERMGITIKEERDRLSIVGSSPKRSVIDTYDDHRIAMAFSILGSIAGETVINDAECVSKTFPQFWDVFKNIGGKVQFDGK